MKAPCILVVSNGSRNIASFLIMHEGNLNRMIAKFKRTGYYVSFRAYVPPSDQTDLAEKWLEHAGRAR